METRVPDCEGGAPRLSFIALAHPTQATQFRRLSLAQSQDANDGNFALRTLADGKKAILLNRTLGSGVATNPSFSRIHAPSGPKMSALVRIIALVLPNASRPFFDLSTHRQLATIALRSRLLQFRAAMTREHR